MNIKQIIKEEIQKLIEKRASSLRPGGSFYHRLRMMSNVFTKYLFKVFKVLFLSQKEEAMSSGDPYRLLTNLRYKKDDVYYVYDIMTAKKHKTSSSSNPETIDNLFKEIESDKRFFLDHLRFEVWWMLDRDFHEKTFAIGGMASKENKSDNRGKIEITVRLDRRFSEKDFADFYKTLQDIMIHEFTHTTPFRSQDGSSTLLTPSHLKGLDRQENFEGQLYKYLSFPAEKESFASGIRRSYGGSTLEEKIDNWIKSYLIPSYLGYSAGEINPTEEFLEKVKDMQLNYFAHRYPEYYRQMT